MADTKIDEQPYRYHRWRDTVIASDEFYDVEDLNPHGWAYTTYALDALTGMGEDPYSCGEWCDAISDAEAAAIAHARGLALEMVGAKQTAPAALSPGPVTSSTSTDDRTLSPSWAGAADPRPAGRRCLESRACRRQGRHPASSRSITPPQSRIRGSAGSLGGHPGTARLRREVMHATGQASERAALGTALGEPLARRICCHALLDPLLRRATSAISDDPR